MNRFFKTIGYTLLFIICIAIGQFVSAQEQDDSCELTPNDVYFKAFSGDISTGKKVILVLETSDTCGGHELHVKLRVISKWLSYVGDRYDTITLSNRESNEIQITPTPGKNTYLTYEGDDEGCFTAHSPDCWIFTEIENKNGTIIYSAKSKIEEIVEQTDELPENDVTRIDILNENNFKEGVLLKDCSNILLCDLSAPWRISSLRGAKEINGDAHLNDQPDDVSTNSRPDIESPCFDTSTGGYIPDCYEPLAPFPDNAENSIFKTDPDTGRQYLELKNLQIGDYINQIFRIGLAILMVIAIIMIIIAGLQYMTVESFYGKSDARKKITNALIGLIIALGISIILGTINPQLLEVNFTSGLKTLQINFDAEPGDGFDYNNIPSNYPGLANIATDGSYKPKGCPEGIVLVNGIHICDSMSGFLEDLISAAKEDNFILTGGGFRSAAQQIWLRKKNCQPNWQTKKSNLCTPPTASPGKSNHEAGLAVDFRCNGGSVTGTCFQWMKKNAGKYNFYNLPSEPWHWSWNGK